LIIVEVKACTISLNHEFINKKFMKRPVLIGRIDEKTFDVYIVIAVVFWAGGRTDMDTILSF
jgi:hypothetical protein